MSVYDKTLVRKALESGRLNRTHLRVIHGGASEPGEMRRPRTRADCVDGPRPCVFVGCRHNTFLDVTDIGGVKMNHGLLDADEVPPETSCVLDMAEVGGMTLKEVGDLLHLTRERVRQIEWVALGAARREGMVGPLRDFAVVRASEHLVELAEDEIGSRMRYSDADYVYADPDDGLAPEERTHGAAWTLEHGEFPAGSQELATDRVWAAYERGVEERKREGK